jgi:hypothetical protein
MAESRGALSRIFSIVLLTATGLGLYNVYSDNDDVRAMAERAACGDRACTAKITRESRSPISQSFTFQTRLIEKKKNEREASVDVECQRSMYLIGEYRCSAPMALPP